MSSLEEHNLINMMIEQEIEGLQKTLTTNCLTCFMNNSLLEIVTWQLKNGRTTNEKYAKILDQLQKHLRNSHNFEVN